MPEATPDHEPERSTSDSPTPRDPPPSPPPGDSAARPALRGHTLRLALLAGLFPVTGMTGLLTEQVFEKLLSTVVGASTPAGAIVLAVYFAGLTLGGLAYGLVSTRSRHPLRLYGVLEGLVGAWCLVLWAGFPWVQAGSAQLIHLAGQSPTGVFVLRLLVAALWILPPTTAMGMTFPAVVGALKQLRAERPQLMISRFYALNLLGAVAGAAAGPFLVFPRIGVSNTLLGTGIVGGLVLSAVTALSRGIAPVAAPAPPEAAARRRLAGLGELLRRDGVVGLLGLAAFSGFLVFGLEVLWTHLIGAVIGTSTYAFGTMLTVVLAGLFCGGLVSSLLWREGAQVPAWCLVLALAVAAVCLGLSFSTWDHVPALLGRWGAGLDRFADGEILRFVFAALLIGPSATALGLVFPMLFRLRWFPTDDADRMAGVMVAVNAVGCITGALALGFWLLPGIGSELSLRLVIVGTAVAACVVSAVDLRLGWRRGGRPAALLSALFAAVALAIASHSVATSAWDPLALTSGINVYLRPSHVLPSSRLLFFHEDSYGGFTTVVENPSPDAPPTRVLLTNGKFQGNDSGEMSAQIAFALIPILHQPRRDSALVIGLGTGHSTEVVAAAGFRSIDVAEISPGMVEAARAWFGHVNRGVLDRQEVRLHVEDGRNVLLRTGTRYDLVTMEISSIWFAGASSLYTRDFYELARARLAPGGVFQQWIQLHHIAPAEVMSVIATMCASFDHVTVWLMGGQAILVASPSPLSIHPEVMAELATRPALARDLEVLQRIEGFGLDGVPGRLLLDEDGTRRVAAFAARTGIPLNTDRNRYLEYATPRHNLERRNHMAEVVDRLTRIASR